MTKSKIRNQNGLFFLQPARLDWDRWLMMGLIGFSVGILGFLLHQIIDLIAEVKWEQTKEYISAGEFSTALMWTFCYSLVFLIVSTLLVVYQPAAAGSGIPEIIGFLNGTRIPDIFKVISTTTWIQTIYQPRAFRVLHGSRDDAFLQQNCGSFQMHYYDEWSNR